MKFTATFKSPDALDDAIDRAVRKDLSGANLSDGEIDLVVESRREEIRSAVEKWFFCGEYVSVEVDTYVGTAIVLPGE